MSSKLHDRLRHTPSMANHVVAMLSKMFSLAQTWELVPRAAIPARRSGTTASSPASGS